MFIVSPFVATYIPFHPFPVARPAHHYLQTQDAVAPVYLLIRVLTMWLVVTAHLSLRWQTLV